MNRLLTILACCVLTLNTWAITRYSHPGNGYGSLLHGATEATGVTVGIGNDMLEIKNNTTNEYCLIDSTNLPSSFRYSVKLSNASNRRGKSVKAKRHDGTLASVSTQRWGIVIDATPQGDMITIELQCNNDDAYNDVTGSRTMNLVLTKQSRGTSTVLKSVTLNKDIDLYNGDNTLSVDVEDGNIRILAGRNKPKAVMETSISRHPGISRVGIMAGAGAHVKVKRTLLSYDDSYRMVKLTDWTIESLKQYLEKSNDPMEGIWEYLDRDMEEKTARMGGRYKIATVSNNNDGYEIIYLDGASVNDRQWQPFMLKGSLKKTIFTGNYDATWIESQFKLIDKDVHASIENAVILTVKFPVLKSQLRFSKALKEIY